MHSKVFSSLTFSDDLTHIQKMCLAEEIITHKSLPNQCLNKCHFSHFYYLIIGIGYVLCEFMANQAWSRASGQENIQYRVVSLAIHPLDKSKMSPRYPLDTRLLSFQFPQFITCTLHLFPKKKHGLSLYKSTMSLQILMPRQGTVLVFVGRMGLSHFPVWSTHEKATPCAFWEEWTLSWAKIINPNHLPSCTQSHLLNPFNHLPQPSP